jgi:hypothetical protein
MATVSHLAVACSDHMGLLLNTNGNSGEQRVDRRRKKLFRFEKAWIHEAGCEEVIAGAWNVIPIGTAMYRVAEKIKQCRMNLIQWSQAHVRVTPRLIE